MNAGDWLTLGAAGCLGFGLGIGLVLGALVVKRLRGAVGGDDDRSPGGT